MVVVTALLLPSIGSASSPSAAATTESAPPLKLGRVQTQSRDGVTVQLAIPTDDEVARYFGVPLADKGVQPIWFRIVNTTDAHYWILPVAIDPDYYTADEVALVVSKKVAKAAATGLTEKFRQNALPFFLGANSDNEGYVYASHRRGGRFVDVKLAARGTGLRMRFAVMLPTEGFDYELSPLRELYANVGSFPDLTRDETRVRVREMPCCTANANGTGKGDPLNVVLVGDGETVISALTAAGWDFTEAITVDSVRRMVGAAIAEKAMMTAPVSSLYAFGRKQDLALQRGRSQIAQRNHMRLWLAPFRCEGQPVWVGQVSRDIGVKATSKSPTLTTHVIDPNVDEAREYLLQGLLHQNAVEWFAMVRGVGAASHEQPARNLADDPYFTDGMRVAIGVSHEPIPEWQALDLDWNESTDPVREGKGEDGTVRLPKKEP